MNNNISTERPQKSNVRSLFLSAHSIKPLIIVQSEKKQHKEGNSIRLNIETPFVTIEF